MRKRFPNTVRVLVVLAMVCSLLAITIAPAGAQTVTSNGAPPPVSGPVGQSVNIVATGFLPSAILTITMDGVKLTTSPATVTTGDGSIVPAGQATFGIVIPAAEWGDHKVTITDGVNTLQGLNWIQVEPKVVISPVQGTVASSATVTGSGFAAGVTALVTVGGQTFASGVPVAADGSFTATGTIPLLGAGDQVVDAIDGAGAVASVAGNADTFKVTPTLTMSPSSALAGDDVTVKGSGWETGAVTLFFAGAFWDTVTADANGVIDDPGVTIPPAQLPGVKKVEGTDTALTPNTAETTFTVLPRVLELSPSSGPLGTTVMLLGEDMTPSAPPNMSIIDVNDLVIATNISLNPGGIQPGAIEIDTTGSISPTTFVIPAEEAGGQRLPIGANTIQAMDGGADYDDNTLLDNLSAFGTFTVTKPTISVNPVTGPRGTTITITGAGWVPDNPVTITFQGATARTVTSIPDANGAFGATLVVPADANRGANNEVRAADMVINEVGVEVVGNQAEPVKYTVPPPAIAVSPTSGVPGTDQVTISGDGFGAYTSVTIQFGTAEFADKPLTDRFGAFEYTATCPGQPQGAIVVRATAAGETATTFFTVEEEPDTVAVATASISGKLVRVWGYYDGEWQMYDPADPVGSDLMSLTPGRGYWIKVTEDCTLIFGGFSYDLKAGWNNIGWR